MNSLESFNLEYVNDDDISNLYMIYLINLYFCAEQTCQYFMTLKEKYNNIKIIEVLERNVEKRELLKVFDSIIEYEEPNNLKKFWSDIKKENILVKNNSTLNEQLKKYVKENDDEKISK